VNLIYVENKSTVVPDAEFQAAVAAVQSQVTKDFAPVWGIDATITTAPTADPPAWKVSVLDDSDQAGALGYHDDGPAPWGRVFAATDRKYGLLWTVTLSHEVLELLADPFINSANQTGRARFHALEVCDPVESDGLSYMVGNVAVSDFIYPSWYGSPGFTQYDHTRNLSGALQLAPGGYCSRWTPWRGWVQDYKRSSHPSRHDHGHRFDVRTRGGVRP